MRATPIRKNFNQKFRSLSSIEDKHRVSRSMITLCKLSPHFWRIIDAIDNNINVLSATVPKYSGPVGLMGAAHTDIFTPGHDVNLGITLGRVAD